MKRASGGDSSEVERNPQLSLIRQITEGDSRASQTLADPRRDAQRLAASPNFTPAGCRPSCGSDRVFDFFFPFLLSHLGTGFWPVTPAEPRRRVAAADGVLNSVWKPDVCCGNWGGGVVSE